MRLRALLALAAAALLAVPAAHADGDPASDLLLARDTFYPFTTKVSQDNQKQLDALVAEAKRKRFRIKVALIAGTGDLGAVPSLWRKPETYARFLGQELFFVYKGPLLVVMPNGYGVSRGGKALASWQRVVDRLAEPGDGGDALAATAAAAVHRLAAQNGVRLSTPQPVSSSGGSHTTRDRLVLGGIALGLLALVGLGVLGRRLLERR
jgi:hypothetical protein